MSKTQVGRLIKPDGTEETIRPAKGGKFSLEELQKAVGGYIEIVFPKPGNGRGTFYINEEGKLQSPPLPVNPKATGMIRLFPGDAIVGNMLVVTRE